MSAGGSGDSADQLGDHVAEVLGHAPLRDALAGLTDRSPRLAAYITRCQLGDLSADAALDPREANLLIAATLAALGDCGDQLGIYARGALTDGSTPEELQDVLHTVAVYAGSPRAVNAVRAIAEAEPSALGSPRRESVVTLADHRTGVITAGNDGPTPILLMHALCMDRHYWRAVAPVLATRAPVIAYDLRSHGLAGGGSLPTSLDQLADDAAELLDRLDVERADVYGASYGGAIAQHLALRHPGRVRGLALIATGAKFPRDELRARAANAERDGMAAQVPESLARWFLPDTVAHNTWGVRYARARLLRARVEDWAASWRTMADLDTVDRLAEITAPTLVVSGDQDLSSTPELMNQLAQGLPNGRLASMSPGTHMMVLEQPEVLAQHLMSFRAEVDTVMGAVP
jgi:3-oxoadipate enol-lactonase